MREVILVRHGETDWNAAGRWQGKTDIPLNEVGIEQARLLAARLARERLAALFTSDLARALRTAEIVGERLGLVPIAERDFSEIDVGRWAGLTSREAAVVDPDLHRRFQGGEDVPRGGGERFAELVERAGKAFDRIAPKYPGERVAIISHGGVVRAILQHALPHRTDLSIPTLAIGNTSVTTLALRDGRWQLEGLDDRSHLAAAAPPLDTAPADDAERV